MVVRRIAENLWTTTAKLERASSIYTAIDLTASIAIRTDTMSDYSRTALRKTIRYGIAPSRCGTLGNTCRLLAQAVSPGWYGSLQQSDKSLTIIVHSEDRARREKITEAITALAGLQGYSINNGMTMYQYGSDTRFTFWMWGQRLYYTGNYRGGRLDNRPALSINSFDGVRERYAPHTPLHKEMLDRIRQREELHIEVRATSRV